jgi:hypothetical protein
VLFLVAVAVLAILSAQPTAAILRGAMPEESTTPDLVELVRKQLEALDRGDLDGVMSNVAEDGVLDGRAGLEEGRTAIRDFVEEWWSAYEELDFELEEISYLGAGLCLQW